MSIASPWQAGRWTRIEACETVPPMAAVYAIYMDETLVYVGQTTNLRSRLSGHQIRFTFTGSIHTRWGFCKTLHIKVSPSRRHGDWAMRELRLIRRLRPAHNVTHNKGGPA